MNGWDHIVWDLRDVIASLEADAPTPDLTGVTRDRGDLEEALRDRLNELAASVGRLLERAHTAEDDAWETVRQELLDDFSESCDPLREAFSYLHDAIVGSGEPRASVRDDPVESLRSIESAIFWLRRRR